MRVNGKAVLFCGSSGTGNRCVEAVCENLAAAVYVEKMKQWRITLLPGVLLAARHTVMLVAGQDKQKRCARFFKEPYDPKRYPAQLKADAWFMDEAAARLIN